MTPILYRPFDIRWTIWDSNVAVHRRERANNRLLHPNLGLLLPKQTKNDWGCLVTEYPAAHKSASVFDPTSIIPLWLFSTEAGLIAAGKPERFANLSADFLAELSGRLDGAEASPKSIFAYIYAVLYAPSYRARYAEFMRRDFPRISLPDDPARFMRLATLGKELIDLHLLRRSLPAITEYPKAGGNRVDRIEFRPGAENPEQSSVWINADQYFENMPRQVWEYTIGGYQVAHKWLKDRKGCLLTFDELQHYGRVIAALNDTIRLQTEIDKALSSSSSKL